jgi:NADH:ubiquinone oxidoreductase subunit F (NADH-binding)
MKVISFSAARSKSSNAVTFLSKLNSSSLVGRGGACFPTGKKWEMVLKEKGKKYVVCNGSEGEPGVDKDGFILKNHPRELVEGIKIAMKFLNAEEGIIYLNHDYFNKYNKSLKKFIGNSKISIFKKPNEAGYIGGIETAVLNVIEDSRSEPRLRPPFPVSKGLFGNPTLVNNVETFYDVYLVKEGTYKKERFYTISGDCKNKGVYSFSENETIGKILRDTGNYPDGGFFVQVGGDASGEVLNMNQIDRKVPGAGSITIHRISKHNPLELMKYWTKFFQAESCGKCTPCREGTFRIREITNSRNPDWNLFVKLLENMQNSAFCALGNSVHIPFFSYFKNVFPKLPKKEINSVGNHEELIKICRKINY